MAHYKNHLLSKGSTIKQALVKLNKLAEDSILFVVDLENKLLGSLTDGDIRRGLINGVSVDDTVDSVSQHNPRFIRKGESNIDKLISYREKNLKIIPVLDHGRLN